MIRRIGIRREDKNEWEARVPITPADTAKLIGEGVEIWLQPSPIRIYRDEEYRRVGAVINEDLSSCPVILAVKEIPSNFFERGKTYIFFSHTIKGQSYNIPMLKKMMELKCILIDYELVTDEQGNRLIFFGRHAGLAGLIDTFWAFGKRLQWEGHTNPFSAIKMAHEYASLDDAKTEIRAVGERLQKEGIPTALGPLIFGFAGYGNVSQGAQEIFDLFPHLEISQEEVARIHSSSTGSFDKLYKVVFKEEDIVEPVDPQAAFALQDYYDNPEKYKSKFESYLPHLSVLVNCIYWDEKYPRLVTNDWLKRAYSKAQKPRLKVIGDITCDIDGSIQCTVKATDPGNPVFVYNPIAETVTDGWEGNGPVIMAVDNLPCELAQEASEFFSKVLTPFVPRMVAQDYHLSFDDLTLPEELKRAAILHQGELTPKYTHLNRYI